MFKNRKISIGLVIILGFIVFVFIFKNPEENKNIGETKLELNTETFIKKHLVSHNGLIKTDFFSQSNIYLSESLGLWMKYLVAKNDRYEFDNQVQLLNNCFLGNSLLVPWRKVDNENADANALIDDLRIIEALFDAGEMWGVSTYIDLASDMSKELLKYNMKDGYFVDHVNIGSKYAGDFLTLSYLNPTSLNYMRNREILSEEQYTLHKELLNNAPVSRSGFFPKTFYPQTESFEYDEEVNLIDQYYVGYHRALWDGDVSNLIQFTKEMLSQYGVLYGKFSNLTKEPLVEYEGMSVYALAILMAIEVNELDLAKELYLHMQKFQILDESNEYSGGYMDLNTMNTHSFGNLLPLIAQRSVLDAGLY